MEYLVAAVLGVTVIAMGAGIMLMVAIAWEIFTGRY